MTTLLYSVAGCIKCCHCGPEALKIGDMVELDLDNAAVSGLPDKIRATVVSLTKKLVPVKLPPATPGGPDRIISQPGHEYGLEYDETLLSGSSLLQLRQCDIVGLPRCLTCCDLIETHSPLTLTSNPGVTPTLDLGNQILNIPPVVVHPAVTLTTAPGAAPTLDLGNQILNIPPVVVHPAVTLTTAPGAAPTLDLGNQILNIPPTVVHPEVTLTNLPAPFSFNVPLQTGNIPSVAVTVNAGAQTITVGGVSTPMGVSSDSLNLLVNGTDGRAFLNCEAVQDCIGQAIAAGVGLTYDDAMDAIRNWITSLTFTDSNSIDFTATAGAPNMSITAEVRLLAGGGLQHNPGGISAVSSPGISTLLDCTGSPLTPGVQLARCSDLHSQAQVTNDPLPFASNIPNQVFNIPQVAAGPGMSSLTVGGLTTNLDVSADAGNTAVVGSDGLVLVRQRPTVAAEYTWDSNFSVLTLAAASGTAGAAFLWTDSAAAVIGSSASQVVSSGGTPGYRGGRYTVTVTDPVTGLTNSEMVYVDLPSVESNTVFVDYEFGSDATGRREYRDLPFATFDAAYAAAVAGDTIRVLGNPTIATRMNITTKAVTVDMPGKATVIGGILLYTSGVRVIAPNTNVVGAVEFAGTGSHAHLGSIARTAALPGYASVMGGTENALVVDGDITFEPNGAVIAAAVLFGSASTRCSARWRDTKVITGAYLNNDGAVVFFSAGLGNSAEFRDFIAPAAGVYLVRSAGGTSSQEGANTVRCRHVHLGRGISQVAGALRVYASSIRMATGGYTTHLNGNGSSIGVTGLDTDDGVTEGWLFVDCPEIRCDGNGPIGSVRHRGRLIFSASTTFKAPAATGAVFVSFNQASTVSPTGPSSFTWHGGRVDAPLASTLLSDNGPPISDVTVLGALYHNCPAPTSPAAVRLGTFVLNALTPASP